MRLKARWLAERYGQQDFLSLSVFLKLRGRFWPWFLVAQVRSRELSDAGQENTSHRFITAIHYFCSIGFSGAALLMLGS